MSSFFCVAKLCALFAEQTKKTGCKMTSSKLEREKQRLEQAKARYAAAAAREKEKNRKRDTKTKILWGAALLSALEKNPDAVRKIQTLLARELNEKDRAFVGFKDETPRAAEQDTRHV